MRKPTRLVRRDGTVSYKVRYRLNGADTSTTFAALPEDEAEAKEQAHTFAKMIFAVGAAEALEWQHRQDRPEPLASDGPTLDEWAETYIDGRTGVTDGTRHGYRQTYALSYGPRLGKIPLSAITRADVAAALNGVSSGYAVPTHFCQTHLPAWSHAQAHRTRRRDPDLRQGLVRLPWRA